MASALGPCLGSSRRLAALVLLVAIASGLLRVEASSESIVALGDVGVRAEGLADPLPRPWQAAGAFLASATVVTDGSEETSACAPADGAQPAELCMLTQLNCNLVRRSVSDFDKFAKKWRLTTWQTRGEVAEAMCANATAACSKDPWGAAELALQAWGDVLMGGHECCQGLHAPYCTSRASSRVGHFLPFLIVILISLAAFCSPVLCKASVSKPSTLLTDLFSRSRQLEDGTESAAAVHGSPSRPKVPDMSTAELRSVWMGGAGGNGSCLRALPGAEEWATSAADVFSRLQKVFCFQPDSVRNQFEHLLSLWRSHVAVCADLTKESGTEVDERELLERGLLSLHTELLEGLTLLQERMRGPDGPDHLSAAHLPKLAGVMDRAAPAPRLKELAEVSVFLLIWGEAGNLRFMPELICLLTDFAIHSERPPSGAFFEESDGGGGGRSGTGNFKFLTHVVRPVYNTVFDENHDSVGVNAQGKDAKKLKKGYDKFLPPDCANYDDWNELICDPMQLKKCLVLKDGKPLFDMPMTARFAQLVNVDWCSSLSARNTKTHREVHSLWGIFAATHRVWLLHLLLFVCIMCYVAAGDAAPPGEPVLLLGNSAPVRVAAVGLLVPVHAALWKYSRWVTAGHCIRIADFTGMGILRLIGTAFAYAVPLATYALVRYEERTQRSRSPEPYLSLHVLASVIGFARLLLVPAYYRDSVVWGLSSVSPARRVGRAAFWTVVLALKCVLSTTVVAAVYDAMKSLDIVKLGEEPMHDIGLYAFSPFWDEDVIIWLTMWCITFVLFLADTQLWFCLGCSLLGTVIALAQRSKSAASFLFGDAVASVPRLFAHKVFSYTDLETTETGLFPSAWDRVVEWLRYEDKIDDTEGGSLQYRTYSSHPSWKQLNQPLEQVEVGRSGVEEVQLTEPAVFQDTSACERLLRRDLGAIPDPDWPQNSDLQWRLLALSRGLSLEMPRPYQAPYIPGITVLIPHYGETIIMTKDELFKDCLATPADGSTSPARPRHQRAVQQQVPLISFLRSRYDLEFNHFTNRMLARGAGAGGETWPRAGDAWHEYSDFAWSKLCRWASMRSQTLWRTVAGMTLYHPAINCHFQVQRDRSSSLAKAGIWSTNEVFTCLVSMQMYAYFTDTQLEHSNAMLEKFPSSLKIAFIGHEDKGVHADEDNVHPRQKRRYFSCLIDKACRQQNLRRVPRLRVELPGFPILGDGKGDNQNHAIIFTRGQFIQCIDANQGAYFEQMLLLPCVLGEFRRNPKKIVGLPEHITSDFGSIGDFAASAEMAFGTMLQRTYAALGARMHYGHPDIMNKCYMMQQGGVSKATKTVNLSEDIFAGMDFTLRGNGRTIRHREYFHVAKGRDLGFNTVLMFFSKLSAGTGEQMLSRQVLRLGHLLPLPELLSFFYAHGGFYLTQHLVARGPPLVMLMWLLVVLCGAEEDYTSIEPRTWQESGSQVMAKLLSTSFSWLILLFLTALMMPLLMEMWLQYGFVAAAKKFAKQMGTLAPLHFVFQAKIIGIYTTDEVRYGGATYVNTGRGLPTERRRFIGTLKDKGGLYTDYAEYALYDGALLLVATVLVFAGGAAESGWASIPKWWLFTLGLTIISWLFTPFIFNPYQFIPEHFFKDWIDWKQFFFADKGKHWKEWYDVSQLKPASGLRASVSDLIIYSVFIGMWYTIINSKLHVLRAVISDDNSQAVTFLRVASTIFALLPPVLTGLFATMVHALVAIIRRSENQQIPMIICAVVLISLDTAEGILSLWYFVLLGWTKTFVAGVVLKCSFLSLLITGAECFLRFRFWEQRSGRRGDLYQAVYVWLAAHRFATDLLVSLLILCAMAPGTFLVAIRSRLCRGCSIHQLLIYRDARTGIRTSRVTAASREQLAMSSFDGRFSTMETSSAHGHHPGGTSRSVPASLPEDSEVNQPGRPFVPPTTDFGAGAPPTTTTATSSRGGAPSGTGTSAADVAAGSAVDLEAELEADAAAARWQPGRSTLGPPPKRPVNTR